MIKDDAVATFEDWNWQTSLLNDTAITTNSNWLVTPLPNNFQDGDEGRKAKIFSDFTRYMFEVVVYTFMCGCVSVVGIAANITNLIVFIRQGLLVDSVTASLAGLATADLCCLLTMLWLSINYAIMLSEPPGLPWDPLSVLYITGGWPHVMFTRVTCWITAYVALERCMCVVFPFKVKLLFTAHRSMLIIVTIFFVIVATYIPIFYTHRLEKVLDPITNTTKVGLVFTTNKAYVENICHYINDVIMPTFSLCIVIVSTRITISYLNSSMKWRKSAKAGYATGSEKDESNIKTVTTSDHSTQSTPGCVMKTHNVSETTKSDHRQKNIMSSDSHNRAPPMQSKETKVVRMITLICIIFILCNSPCIIIIYLRFIVPEIANMATYHNLFHILYSIDFLLESFNSTINIVVYYTMSSKYKLEFRRLFGMKDD